MGPRVVKVQNSGDPPGPSWGRTLEGRVSRGRGASVAGGRLARTLTGTNEAAACRRTGREAPNVDESQQGLLRRAALLPGSSLRLGTICYAGKRHAGSTGLDARKFRTATTSVLALIAAWIRELCSPGLLVPRTSGRRQDRLPGPSRSLPGAPCLRRQHVVSAPAGRGRDGSCLSANDRFGRKTKTLLYVLGAGLVAITALAHVSAAWAQTTFVSNLNQSSVGNVGTASDNVQFAQPFMTGTNASGFTLSSIDVFVSTNRNNMVVPAFDASICATSDGLAPSCCRTLTRPSDYGVSSGGGTLTFTDSANTPLNANTGYSLKSLLQNS